jgi:hypothetical protein
MKEGTIPIWGTKGLSTRPRFIILKTHSFNVSICPLMLVKSFCRNYNLEVFAKYKRSVLRLVIENQGKLLENISHSQFLCKIMLWPSGLFYL